VMLVGLVGVCLCLVVVLFLFFVIRVFGWVGCHWTHTFRSIFVIACVLSTHTLRA